MIRTVPLSNKPLFLTQYNEEIFIGDARGRVLRLSRPFFNPECLAVVPGPVSTIFFANGNLIYGTWDGILYSKDKEVKLGEKPIKCGCFFNEKIYVSIGTRLIVLDTALRILEQMELKAKVFCMNIFSGKLYLGMSDGSVCTLCDSFSQEQHSDHSMSVLCIKDELTGSTDCTIRKNGKITFEGNGWIRNILSEESFSCGNTVFIDSKAAYSHEDEVTGMTKVGNTIISIGLDYCYKIFEKEIALTLEEEEELLKML